MMQITQVNTRALTTTGGGTLKRVLAIMLALALAVGMLPITAQKAYAGTKEYKLKLAGGTEIKVLEDDSSTPTTYDIEVSNYSLEDVATFEYKLVNLVGQNDQTRGKEDIRTHARLLSFAGELGFSSTADSAWGFIANILQESPGVALNISTTETIPAEFNDVGLGGGIAGLLSTNASDIQITLDGAKANDSSDFLSYLADAGVTIRALNLVNGAELTLPSGLSIPSINTKVGTKLYVSSDNTYNIAGLPGVIIFDDVYNTTLAGGTKIKVIKSNSANPFTPATYAIEISDYSLEDVATFEDELVKLVGQKDQTRGKEDIRTHARLLSFAGELGFSSTADSAWGFIANILQESPGVALNISTTETIPVEFNDVGLGGGIAGLLYAKASDIQITLDGAKANDSSDFLSYLADAGVTIKELSLENGAELTLPSGLSIPSITTEAGTKLSLKPDHKYDLEDVLGSTETTLYGLALTGKGNIVLGDEQQISSSVSGLSSAGIANAKATITYTVPAGADNNYAMSNPDGLDLDDFTLYNSKDYLLTTHTPDKFGVYTANVKVTDKDDETKVYAVADYSFEVLPKLPATLVFDGNGGDSYEPTLNVSSLQISKLPTAERNGYKFLGWFTGQSDGTKVNAYSNITDGVYDAGNKTFTFYAHWESIVPLGAELEAAKQSAIDELSAYASNYANYRSAEQLILLGEIYKGQNNVKAATTPAYVAKALADAKAAIENIKTDAQLKAEEAPAAGNIKSISTAIKTVYVQKGKTIKIPYIVYANAGHSGKTVTADWRVSTISKVSVGANKPKQKLLVSQSVKLDAKSVIKIKGNKVGTTNLSIKVGTKTLKIKVKVIKKAKVAKVLNFKLNKFAKALKVGAVKTIKVSKINKNAASNIATFKIAAKYAKYLKVDAAGKLTALKAYKAGKKDIPVKVKVGKKTATIKIKVSK